jgi:hypothetical protein
MHTVLVAGVLLTALHGMAIAIAEGPRALARPLDLRGLPPNREPIKRAYFHLGFTAGIVCLLVAGAASIGSGG